MFLLCSHRRAIVASMPDDKLTPADPVDLAWSIAFALRFEGKKRWHDADDMMAAIVADRIVKSLERSGYVIMKKPPSVGGGTIQAPDFWPLATVRGARRELRGRDHPRCEG